MLNASAILAGGFSGWDIGRTSSALFIEGRKVYESTGKISAFPGFLKEDQKIDLAFYLTDFFLLKGDKEGIANIIYLLRNEKGDYKLADFLISALWKIKKNDIEGAKKKLNEFSGLSSDDFQKKIASIIAENLTSQSSSPESLDVLRNLSCIKNQNYYSICRFLKLKSQIDKLSIQSTNFHRDYLNLDRVLAPFFEEYILNQPHLINRLIPKLPEKLAYLGFAEEAVHFQNLILQREQIAGDTKISTFEKISFYQMLSGNIAGAEEILRQSIKAGAAKNPEEKNQIFLKLGAIAYIRKEYKQSMNYYMNLNFKKWNNQIYNPFRFEPISVGQAKDLVSVTIWKLRGPVKAVKALKLIKKPDSKLSEEDLLIRSRIAQIIFPDKPDVAEKIAEEVIYTAQSRGWKRAEYAGTLLQGYIHIINKNYRKSVIHFTKSYGILGENDPEMTSERMRLNGIISAHLASGEIAPVEKPLHTLMRYMRTTPENDDISAVKYFLDSRFSLESFVKKSILYFSETKQYSSLLKLLYSNSRIGYHELGMNSKGILQVPFVAKRLKLYASFRPKDENSFYSGIQATMSRTEAERSHDAFDNFDDSNFSQLKNPFVAGIAFQKDIYLFLYLPDKSSDNSWKMAKFASSDYKGNLFNKTLVEFSEQVPKNKILQIYFNSIGIDIYQHLKSKGNGYYSLFHNFSLTAEKNKRDSTQLIPVTVLPENRTIGTIKSYTAANFEGSRTFDEKNRLHIWNFQGTKKEAESTDIENYQWLLPNKETISFKKMRRRMDARMAPNALIFTADVLKKSFWDLLSGDFYPFVDFWFRKGVDAIYYTPSLNPGKEKSKELISTLTAPLNSSEELHRVLAAIKVKNDDVILLYSSLK